MNPAVQQAINDINAYIVANGNQEITAEVLNPILLEMVNSLFDITGDDNDLTTAVKTNIVAAINYLKDEMENLSGIKHYTGGFNPNTTPPNGGNFNLLDFYTQTGVGGAESLWIYAGISGIGWLNLTDRQVLFVGTLPTAGASNKIYILTSDNTLWRWQTAVFPGGWEQLGGSGSSVLYTPQELTLEQKAQARDNIDVTSNFKQKFDYESTSNPSQEFQLGFIPTNIHYVVATNSFIWGADIGESDYSVDIETGVLTINTEIKDGDFIIIYYEHKNIVP